MLRPSPNHGTQRLPNDEMMVLLPAMSVNSNCIAVVVVVVDYGDDGVIDGDDCH